jgi:CBS domain containing-hemolysin-like protein
MDVFLKICAILALVGLNAFFVAAEFALVGARSIRLQTLAAAGDHKARLALSAIDHVDDCISGSQLGITLTSLGLGWIGVSTMVGLIAHLFHGLPSALAVLSSHAVATTLAFACITFLHIVLGEQAPKLLALVSPEDISRWVARPLLLFTYVFWPAIRFQNKSAYGFLRLFGVQPPSHVTTRVHSPEELLLLLSESREHGLVDAADAEMIEGVLDLSRISARQAMTPRTEVRAVERQWPLEKIVETVRASGFSRLPVYEEDLDHIVGILLAKDLLDYLGAQTPFRTDHVMREPFFTPAGMPVDDLMKELQQRNAHMAIVVDEYGGTLGLVTLEDVIEWIVGDIFDEFDRADDSEAVLATSEGHLSVPGDLPLADLNERYKLHLSAGDYVTVAGLVLSALGHVPSVGQHVQVDGVTFQVTAMDRQRIERLEVTLPDTEDTASTSASDTSK